MELADGVSANKIWEREGIPQALRVRIRMSYTFKGARPRHVAALSLILAWQFPKLWGGNAHIRPLALARGRIANKTSAPAVSLARKHLVSRLLPSNTRSLHLLD